MGYIAAKHGKTTGQVLLSWSIQRGGWSVVPKSSNPGRMAQNLGEFYTSLKSIQNDALTCALASHVRPLPGGGRRDLEAARGTGQDQVALRVRQWSGGPWKYLRVDSGSDGLGPEAIHRLEGSTRVGQAPSMNEVSHLQP